MRVRHLLRWLVTSLATLLLLWQVASVLVQAMPVRDGGDYQAVSACDCSSGMCHPELIYHAHLREYVVGSFAWAHTTRISPALPELRPELKVSLVQVAAPATGHILPDGTIRLPVASPFLRSPKLLL